MPTHYEVISDLAEQLNEMRRERDTLAARLAAVEGVIKKVREPLYFTPASSTYTCAWCGMWTTDWMKSRHDYHCPWRTISDLAATPQPEGASSV